MLARQGMLAGRQEGGDIVVTMVKPWLYKSGHERNLYFRQRSLGWVDPIVRQELGEDCYWVHRTVSPQGTVSPQDGHVSTRWTVSPQGGLYPHKGDCISTRWTCLHKVDCIPTRWTVSPQGGLYLHKVDVSPQRGLCLHK